LATSDLLSRFTAARTLHEYPHGSHRWSLLLLTVVATILASYEFQLAPILPILLPFLHLSQVGYGYFITFAVLVSGISAFFGGPLADRYGRVALIDLCLGVTVVLVFCNLLIVNITTFVLIRTLMSVVAGLMAGAGAALMRDMSPRVDRALAFGLLTIGPVGANFLANKIAALTLPIYHTWQSQIWITAFLGLVMFVPIVMWLRDLSADLRLQIFRTEVAALEARGVSLRSADLPSSSRDAYARLLKHPEIWLQVIGITANLTLYFAITAFGPLMFTQAFKYSPAEAAAMNSNFWLCNLAVLVVTGFVSDRLQIRKPIAIIGAALSIALLVWWVPSFTSGGLPRGEMAIVAAVLGGFLAIGYVPWAAHFSETLEEVSPALQATGWALFGLAVRVWAGMSAPLTLWVAKHYGWQAWIKVSIAGLAIYILVLLITRGIQPEATAESAVEEGAQAGATR
jgi:MFS family permease